MTLLERLESASASEDIANWKRGSVTRKSIEAIRQLDFEIERYVAGENWPKSWDSEGSMSYDLPRYTSSLDAAMTLLASHWCWRYDSALGYAEVFNLGESPIVLGTSSENGPLVGFKPPALALCIAAIKAHQAR